MLCEYVRPVSHESWLSAEERRRMSERNRGAASGRKQDEMPVRTRAEAQIPEKTSAPRRRRRAKPAAPTAEERLAARQAREREEMLARMRQTEENRMRAMQRMILEDEPEAAEAEEPENGLADEIVAEIAANVDAEAAAKAEEPDARERMLERMRKSERNRMRARYGEDYYEPEQTEPEEAEPETARTQQSDPEEDADTLYSYRYESDTKETGKTHADFVAKSFLRHSRAPWKGFYVSYAAMVSGSSALQPEETYTDAQPEIGYLSEEDLASEQEQTPMPEMALRAAGRNGGSRKVRGGRYSEYGKSAGYQRRITTGGAVIIGLLTVLLIGCVIYGKVQTNEIYTTLAELQAEYDDITAQNVSMRSEMEGKMTVKNIEDYAENVLGLRQLDQSQIEYIQIQTEDEVVITEPEENLIVTINDYLTSFWEFLRGA